MAQHGADLLVDMCRTEHSGCGDILDRAEHHRAQLDRVDAEVEECPTAALGIEQPVAGIDGHAEAEVGIDLQRGADATAGEDVGERPVRRQEATPDRLHQEALAGLRRGDHPSGLACVEGERLLAQHVLAGLEVANCVRLVP